MSIKYYHLAKNEELPDEFCAIRDVGGEPSEYVFYVPDAENVKLQNDAELLRRMFQAKRQETHTLMSENVKLRKDNDRLVQAIEDLHDIKLEDKLMQLENENDKLRELLKVAWKCTNTVPSCLECKILAGGCKLLTAMHELGVEVDE